VRHTLFEEESGMTMVLVIMTMVIIGVMGAGLLVFTMRDLQSVATSNQGQTAADMADAGMQAAAYQLAIIDSRPSDYDGDPSNGESRWSDAGGQGWRDWKQLTFGDGRVYVGIRYLRPADPNQTSQPGYAPEPLPSGQTSYPNDRNYFEVTVGAQANGAVRWYQAIYYTENFDIPVAYYATRNIDFNGNSFQVEGISLFARGNITDVRADNIGGVDQAYGNWKNQYNATARPTDAAGVAALGTVTYKPGKANVTGCGTQVKGCRDYDGTSTPRFVADTWTAAGQPQPSDTITFPFRLGDTASDNQALADLEYKAKAQGLYFSVPSSQGFTIDSSNYPALSNPNTVIYIDFTGTSLGNATYKVTSTSNPDGWVKGTIVVVNGNLTMSDAGKLKGFEGAVIVRDGNPNGQASDPNVPTFTMSGNFTLHGFANVEGDMNLSGNLEGMLPGSLVNGIPGLVALHRWSWQECYSVGCGIP